MLRNIVDVVVTSARPALCLSPRLEADHDAHFLYFVEDPVPEGGTYSTVLYNTDTMYTYVRDTALPLGPVASP